MAGLAPDAGTAAAPLQEVGSRPRVASMGFHWTMVLLSAWLVAGLYLDGWAHEHGGGLETFFTPWHGVLYSGFVAIALFLTATAARAPRDRNFWTTALPAGYELALPGVLLFLAGGLADMVWHTLLGVEVEVENLLSPTHLLLALGGVLILSSPFRSLASQPSASSDVPWRTRGPALLSLTFVLAVLAFFTQFAHPFRLPLAGMSHRPPVAPNEIYVIRSDGSGQTRVAAHAGQESWFGAWAPDGSKIAYSVSSSTGDDPVATSAIYVVNRDGSDPVRIMALDEDTWGPAWSPDGRRLTFAVHRDQRNQVYLMGLDGAGRTALTEAEADAYGAVWAPEGERIAFVAGEAGGMRIYVMNSDGSERRALTPASQSSLRPAWSPDGRSIAFDAGAGLRAIYILSAEGTGLRRLTEGPAAWGPSWSPDGRQIAYTRQDGARSEPYVMNSDGTNQRPLGGEPRHERVAGVVVAGWPAVAVHRPDVLHAP